MFTVDQEVGVLILGAIHVRFWAAALNCLGSLVMARIDKGSRLGGGHHSKRECCENHIVICVFFIDTYLGV